MIYNIIGNVDWPAAAIMIALFVGSGIAFAFYRTTQKLNEEELAIEKEKMRLEAARYQYQQETNRMLETKKLEQNLITSHRAE